MVQLVIGQLTSSELMKKFWYPVANYYGEIASKSKFTDSKVADASDNLLKHPSFYLNKVVYVLTSKLFVHLIQFFPSYPG